MRVSDENKGSDRADRRGGLQVGAVRLHGRALLAPMSGVTDPAFRRAASAFGAAATVSEMVASDAFVRGDAEAQLRAQSSGFDPHIVQLAGCHAAWMAEAARCAEGAGAGIVDINMGCPAKRVTGGEAGSALMRDLDHALRLIDATVAAVSVPVTLKMRLGWDDESCNAADLARRAEAAGIAMVSVHARTRCQFYAGSARWAELRAVKDAVRIPVVANGDCRSFADADAMLAASGADAVMLGRAALGRPWFAGQLVGYLSSGRIPAEPPTSSKQDASLQHLDSLLRALGASKGLRHARKHLAAYADRAGASAAARGQLVTSESPAEVKRLLHSIFEQSSIVAEAA